MARLLPTTPAAASKPCPAPRTARLDPGALANCTGDTKDIWKAPSASGTSRTTSEGQTAVRPSVFLRDQDCVGGNWHQASCTCKQQPDSSRQHVFTSFRYYLRKQIGWLVLGQPPIFSAENRVFRNRSTPFTIITSVDLTSAAALSPRFKRISRAASAVMMEVMCCRRWIA